MDPARKIQVNGPTLGLYVPPAGGVESPTNWRRGVRLTPASKVRNVFEHWYLQSVLGLKALVKGKAAREKTAREKTADAYGVSLDWWELLTEDPSIEAIDVYARNEFVEGLSGATFRRGPTSPLYPMQRSTAANHANRIGYVLERCGPQFNHRKDTLSLVEKIPFLRVPAVHGTVPGYAFSLDELRNLVAAAQRLGDRIARAEWLVRLALMFYAGLRIGSTLRVTRSMLSVVEGRVWLTVPGEDVKTGHALAVPCHAELLAAIDRLPATHHYLAPWSMHPRTLVTHHERLQLDAGITDPSGFHAHRRANARESGLVGADDAKVTAQVMLGHKSSKTTDTFYCRAKNLIVDRLPALGFAAARFQSRLF